MSNKCESQLICPYCKHKCGKGVLETWHGERGDYFCPECENVFRYEVKCVPMFSSWKKGKTK